MIDPSDEIMERARGLAAKIDEPFYPSPHDLTVIARAITEAEARGEARGREQEREACAKRLDEEAMRLLDDIVDGDEQGRKMLHFASGVLMTEATAIRKRIK